MTKRARTTLFIILLLAFLVSAPLIVLYSQGYRFDFQNWEIFRTGGFYFKVVPTGANVYLNNKLKAKTDFFFGAALISNLSPDSYQIKIEKDGYYTWEKKLEVKEQLVTDAKNIILIPKEPNFESFLTEIESVFFSPDEKKVILNKVVKGVWQLSLLDLERRSETFLLSSKDVKNTEFSDLEWSKDNKRIILKTFQKTAKGKEEKFWVVELREKPEIFSLDFLFGLAKKPEQIYFNPQNRQELYLSQKAVQEKGKIETKNLLTANYGTKIISLEPIIENFLALKFTENKIFWLDEDGFLYESELSGKKIRALNLEPFTLQAQDYEILASPPYFLINDNGVIFNLNPTSKVFEKILDNVTLIEFEPNNKKVVIIQNDQVNILFLENQATQPQKEAGEVSFLFKSSQKIDKIFWLTNHYLIFSDGKKIKIIEIDDRDKINIVELVEFQAPQIFWSKEQKSLYVLSENNLFESQKLLP